MAERKVKFVKGHYYHLYNRGNSGQNIFADDKDFIDFLNRIKKYCTTYSVQVIAYCLMFNHFHLLVRQDGDVKAGMVVQHTCNGYVQYFNGRHGHQGPLFQGRFRCELVGDDAYLHHLCRYIHGNPVKDNFALKPELWPYSNYVDWIGDRQGTQFDPEFIVAHFGTVERYTDYLTDYLVHSPAIPEKLRQYLAQFKQ